LNKSGEIVAFTKSGRRYLCVCDIIPFIFPFEVFHNLKRSQK
jgi:hypothetical protein